MTRSKGIETYMGFQAELEFVDKNTMTRSKGIETSEFKEVVSFLST